MQFIKSLAFMSSSGVRVWLAINVVVFISLFFVYNLFIPVNTDLHDYHSLSHHIVKSKETISLQDEKEQKHTAKESLFQLFSGMNPLSDINHIPLPFSSVDYVIKSGDSLAKIFLRLGLAKEAMYAVLEADQEYLLLDPLLPNDKYTFDLDEHGALLKITRRIDISRSVSYVKHENGGFSYEEHIKPIKYVETTIHSKVIENFYVSAKKVGLSDSNISIIHDVLKGKVDFRRDLRKNDAFEMVVKNGSIDGVQVGDTQLEALQMTVKGQVYRAFLHDNGRFYDQDGNSLTPALQRWPTRKKYRVSSPFDANRLHPITGHRAPHNGVDLAMPIGTKVRATSDGVVTRVDSHKYAGRYVVIDYTGSYGARFLHLSKILVKKGQRVKRDQVIALSGNTGRSTGAHLHYELHINGRPVDPMKTDIPTTQSILKSEQAEFDRDVKIWTSMMAKS